MGKNMKVLLIQPPSSYHRETYPLGLAYLGAVLGKIGCEVRAIDGSARYSFLTIDDIIKEVKSFSPDIIGITLVINLIKEGYLLAEGLSKLGIPIIAGGPHAKLRPYEVLEHHFDIVVRGEGEKTIKELVDCFQGDREISDILGISYKDGNGRIIDNPDRPFIEDLDSIPYPARELFPISNYTRLKQDATEEYWTILAGRGCPYKCIYCAAAQGVFGRKRRMRSAENVFKELAFLKRQYGIRHIKFYDDTLTINRPWLEKLCDMMIENNLDIHWICDSRVDHLTEDFIFKMKEAGCHYMYYGVENYDPETLRRIKKGITIEKIRQTIDWTISAKIDFTIYLILGWPWETYSHIDNTLRFIKSIPNSVRCKHSYFVPIPYPRTELYEANHKRYGFTEWWLKPNTFDENYDQSGYLPYFRANMPYLDHFYLNKNFFKHPKEFQCYLKKTFVIIGKLQNYRIHGFLKSILIGILSSFSLFLYKINFSLERKIFNVLWSNTIRKTAKKVLRI